MATEGEETWEEGAEGEWAEEAEGSYKKPRKAKGETVQYLSDFLADAEAPRIAAHNVARELQWEAASVAADRTGGALLEQLARKCSNRVVERLCRWLAPYVGFLVYHRHGSHVRCLGHRHGRGHAFPVPRCSLRPRGELLPQPPRFRVLRIQLRRLHR